MDIDGSLFTISSRTVNLTTMGAAYVLNDAVCHWSRRANDGEYDDTTTSLPSADDRVFMEGLRNIAAFRRSLRDNSGNEIGTSASQCLVESMARAPRYGNREPGHNGHAETW